MAAVVGSVAAPSNFTQGSLGSDALLLRDRYEGLDSLEDHSTCSQSRPFQTPPRLWELQQLNICFLLAGPPKAAAAIAAKPEHRPALPARCL